LGVTDLQESRGRGVGKGVRRDATGRALAAAKAAAAAI
jgi:hypothetical protein